MPDTSIQEMVLSNDYADFILPVLSSTASFLENYQEMGAQIFGGRLGMIHVPRTSILFSNMASYSQIPKLFTLLDTTSLEDTGIIKVQEQPGLSYTGKDVILGFIDTGIDYTLDIFRKRNGETRILGIWDQTIPGENPSSDLGYGTVYTAEDINLALSSENPYDIVPSYDENGHGTFLAGCAAGNKEESEGFTGAAPNADIVVVKLKTAKQYLKDFFLIQGDAPCYQETDIMMGIKYMVIQSVLQEKPLVLCLGLGTNQGDHNGTSPVERLLAFYINYINLFSVTAAGNEAGKAHHFFSPARTDTNSVTAQISVDSSDEGFVFEIWGNSPGLYGVSITSPLGETIPRIPPRQETTSSFRFLAERSSVEVTYEISEYGSGSQLIFIRLLYPTPGIWNITVSTTSHSIGPFHIWLPVTGFISPDTIFLNPSPDVTLTAPSCTEATITTGCYNAYDGSLYIHSSRGFTRNGSIKPDFCAPGVNVYGPDISSLTLQDGKVVSFRPPLKAFRRDTGSSVSAAITAGAVALLINWSLDRIYQGSPAITNRLANTYLIRGAKRQNNLIYPNTQWGYGKLNLFGIFENLM